MLAVPATDHRPKLMAEIAVDKAGEFIQKCAGDHFYVEYV